MKIAYFDLTELVDERVILGALVDLGFDFNKLEVKLGNQIFSEFGVELSKRIDLIRNDKGVRIKLNLESDLKYRELNYVKLKRIIDSIILNDEIKRQGIEIIQTLFMVEDRISIYKAVKSFIFTFGILLGIKELKIDKTYSSRIQLGTTPLADVLKLLKGKPIFSDNKDKRLVTKLGTAIIINIIDEFDQHPEMILCESGYGIGSKEQKLRISLGDTEDSKYNQDEIITIKANIDDMQQELYDYVMELLLNVGALDVYLTSIQMKKNRPAQQLTVLTDEENLTDLLEILFTETTTLGIRINKQQRYKLKREIRKVALKDKKVDVKLGFRGDELVNIAPEYDSCRQAAKDLDLPLKEVYRRVIMSIDKMNT
ncbi:LarC family nickel insertion protein [Sporohalobacter salinus]|uniref:LarC family nickel insertion protein n=1 Tax=Sporohalobacter salinus TaxID=1494606 RepID=UPI0019607922|nr:LarC family nickel insertion protein [Sporohalobacter salinus]MBM7622716.1 uncharacterized protein (DUF111 family) [Sporohalobacter salinus]